MYRTCVYRYESLFRFQIEFAYISIVLKTQITKHTYSAHPGRPGFVTTRKRRRVFGVAEKSVDGRRFSRIRNRARDLSSDTWRLTLVETCRNRSSNGPKWKTTAKMRDLKKSRARVSVETRFVAHWRNSKTSGFRFINEPKQPAVVRSPCIVSLFRSKKSKKTADVRLGTSSVRWKYLEHIKTVFSARFKGETHNRTSVFSTRRFGSCVTLFSNACTWWKVLSPQHACIN